MNLEDLTLLPGLVDPAGSDLVAFSLFAAAFTPGHTTMSLLEALIRSEFKQASVEYTRLVKFSGEGLQGIAICAPDKARALSVLRKVADELTGVPARKVAWFDKAEGVWRDYYYQGVLRDDVEFADVWKQLVGAFERLRTGEENNG